MRYQVYLDLSPEELRRYYSGAAGTVSVCDRFGRSLRFPAASLRPFVTHGGIKGWFELETDSGQKLKGFRALTQSGYHGP